MKHLFVRCAVIVAAMAILFTGCNQPTDRDNNGGGTNPPAGAGVVITGNPVVKGKVSNLNDELKAYAWGLGITEGNANFEWYADDELITRQDAEKYHDYLWLDAAHVGKKITVKATNPKDTSKTITSDPTDAVVDTWTPTVLLAGNGVPNGKVNGADGELKVYPTGITNYGATWYVNGVIEKKADGNEHNDNYFWPSDEDVGKTVIARVWSYNENQPYVWTNPVTITAASDWKATVTLAGNPVPNGKVEGVDGELKVYPTGITNVGASWYVDGVQVMKSDKPTEDYTNNYFWPTEEMVGKSVFARVWSYSANQPSVWTKPVTIVAAADWKTSVWVAGNPVPNGKVEGVNGELKVYPTGVANYGASWYVDGVQVMKADKPTEDYTEHYFWPTEEMVGKSVFARVWSYNEGDTSTIWTKPITIVSADSVKATVLLAGNPVPNGKVPNVDGELKVYPTGINNAFAAWYVDGVRVRKDDDSDTYNEVYFWPTEDMASKEIIAQVMSYDQDQPSVWTNPITIVAAANWKTSVALVGNPVPNGKITDVNGELKVYPTGITNPGATWYVDGVQHKNTGGSSYNNDYFWPTEDMIGKSVFARVWSYDQNQPTIWIKPIKIEGTWNFPITTSGEAKVGGTELKVNTKPNNVQCRWYVDGVEIAGQDSWGDDYFWPQDEHVGKSIQVRVCDYDDWWGVGKYNWKDFGKIAAKDPQSN